MRRIRLCAKSGCAPNPAGSLCGGRLLLRPPWRLHCAAVAASGSRWK
jgi:hypothetical protein